MTDARDIFCHAGTKDPTPAPFFAHMEYARELKQPKPGEIWTNSRGDMRLIMNAFPRHVVGLLLQTDCRDEGMLPVTTVQGVQYVAPTKPATMLGRDYGDFVKTVSDEEMDAIRERYEEAFCIGDRSDADEAGLTALKAELEYEKKLNDDVCGRLEVLKKQVNEKEKSGQDGVYKELYERLLDRVLKERGL